MKRLDDWKPRLMATLERYDGAAFVWGETDCACFASACIEAVTGRADALGTYRGQYNTRLSAAARIRGRKFRSLLDAAHDRLSAMGFERLPVAFARVGDIGVTSDGVLCVRTVRGFAARGADGQYYEARNVCAAWRIGD